MLSFPYRCPLLSIQCHNYVEREIKENDHVELTCEFVSILNYVMYLTELNESYQLIIIFCTFYVDLKHFSAVIFISFANVSS